MAVKLPRADDLGQLPSVRSGRPIATIDTSAYGRAGKAQADAVASLGGTLSSIGNKLSAQKDAEDEFEAERRFQEFKWSEERQLEEAQRQAKPGDVGRFADDWTSGYKERADVFARSLPDSVRAKYDNKLFGLEREGFRSAAGFARGEQKRFSIASLEDHAKRVATGGDLRKAHESYDEVLNANPYLTPIEKDEIGRKHKEKIRTNHIDWALMSGRDPEEILRDHGYVPGGKMPTEAKPSEGGPLPKSYIDEIKKSEGFTPRASWDYKQHSVGYGTRAKSPGETIDQAEADRRLNDELGKAAAIVDKFAPGLDEGTRAALVSLTFNAGDDWTRQGLGKAIKEGDLARARSLFTEYKTAGGEVLPGLVARRQREAAWFGKGGKGSEVERKELPPPGTQPLSGAPEDETGGGEPEPDDGTGAVSFGPQGQPAEGTTLPKYGDMPLAHSDVHKLRTALSHKYQEKLRSDIARIEEGQAEETDENGLTWFDKAKPILTQNVYNQWKSRRDAAILNRDATTPLINMSEEQAIAHMQGVGRDANGEDRKDIEFAIIRDARKAADSTWGKIVEWRRRDPAAALAEHPVVVRAKNDLNGPGGVGIATAEVSTEEGDPSLPGIVIEGKTPKQLQSARRQLIDATLEAQERVGIPKFLQRTITKEQAQKLINLPDPDTLSDKQVREGLATAAQNIASIYGPEMGERVFKDALALGYKHGGREEMKNYTRWGTRAIEESAASEERFNLLAKQAFGRSITSQDMGRLRMLERLDAMPSVLPDPSTGMNPGQPYIGQPYQSPISATRSQPSDRHSSLLLQKIAENPGKAQALKQDFDLKFGDGAAARVIAKIMNGEGGDER
jgi:GH24 family phage-related lysozyme (muramidase)